MWNWRTRKQRYEELNEEVRGHLEMAANDRVERGDAEEEARAAARKEFGNVKLIKETARDAWGGRWLENLMEDVRYGVRVLRKAPGFSIVAILTLAIGIGANTALFSVVNGVLLNPLPFPEPEQLVTLHESKPNFDSGSISWPNFQDWRKENRTFSMMGIYRPYGFNLTNLGDAEQVPTEFVSTDLLPVLGAKPVLGRLFVEGEDEIGRAPIVLISDAFWKRKFGAAPDVLGKGLTLDGKSYSIVGVVDANFRVQMGGLSPRDLYVPIGQWNNNLLASRGAGLGIHGIGRMKREVTIQQARADMKRVTDALTEAYPGVNTGIGASLIPMKELMVRGVRTLLLVLMAAVGFVLLIACVNVANLLLARSTARTREFAVRAALGAGRGRIVQQLLTESMLLSLVGGGLGLLLAAWGTKAAIHHLPDGLPRANEIGMDARVLVFTAGIAVLCGILFGLAPALRTSRTNLHDTLKEGGRGGSGTRQRAQGAFVVAEMAMALVLLIAAGLMIRSLNALWNVNPGFDARNVVTFGVSLGPSLRDASADAVRAALRELHDKLKEARGVAVVSLSWGAIPLSQDDEDLFWIDGKPKPATENEMSWALSYVVEEDYLRLMGIPLERGRFFTAQDNEKASHVVVVDDVFAEKYFPGEQPIGKRIVIPNKGGLAEIIGVVRHVKQWGLDSDDSQPLRAQLYVPYMQLPDEAIRSGWSGTGVLVKYEGNGDAAVTAMRSAVKSANREQAMFQIQTMNEIIADTLASRRVSMIVLGVFAAVALGLAALGIYGVISYLVGQRTHEIGIRMALGASRGEVLQMILREGAKLSAIGAVIGIAAALGLTRLMSSLLFGVSAWDPVTFVSVMVVLLIVGLAACWMPARRATKVDPMVALRYE